MFILLVIEPEFAKQSSWQTLECDCVWPYIWKSRKSQSAESEKAVLAKRERHITMGRERRRQEETGPNGVVMIFQDQ